MSTFIAYFEYIFVNIHYILKILAVLYKGYKSRTNINGFMWKLLHKQKKYKQYHRTKIV